MAQSVGSILYGKRNLFWLKEISMKILILYYSYGGNTQKVAEMIYEETKADIARIETVTSYSGDYNSVVDQGQQEVNSGYMPAIQPVPIDLSDYDTIILGSPVWWYTFAPAVKTFLRDNDLSGKTIYPFATNGGWIGHTFLDFEKSCMGATVHRGLNVKFNGEIQNTPSSEILNWIRGIK